MTQKEFNSHSLYLDDNQIDYLLKNFGLNTINEVLIDIQNCGSFRETYDYYKNITNVDKVLILKTIDWFSAMDFIQDLKANVDDRLDDIRIKLNED